MLFVDFHRAGNPKAVPATGRKLIWIRHGETVGNRDSILQGHSDSPLTARGRNDIAKIAAVLVGEKITRIVSSDLGRARESAQLIGDRLHLPVSTDRRLRERQFGSLELMSISDVREALDDPRVNCCADLIFHHDTSFEPNHKVLGRTVDFLQDQASESGDGVLLVSHAGILSHLLQELTGLEGQTLLSTFCIPARIDLLVRTDRRILLQRFEGSMPCVPRSKEGPT